MSLLDEMETLAGELIGYEADMPDYTCPDIDKVIDNIKEARTLADKWARETLDSEANYTDEFKELINITDEVLWPLPSDLDNLRNTNEELRAAVKEMGSLCHRAGELLRKAANEWPLDEGNGND